jgi:hypothetical protein
MGELFKKSQITLFVIFGFFILLVVTILLAGIRNSSEEVLQAQAQAKVNDAIRMLPINYYVKSCLEEVTMQGLVLLGEQGGVIYTEQGGLTNRSQLIRDSDYINVSMVKEINEIEVNYLRNVSYVVKNKVNCPIFLGPYYFENYFNEENSFYPVNETYLSNYVSKYNTPFWSDGCTYLKRSTTYSGFLGKNNLAPLFDLNSLNTLILYDNPEALSFRPETLGEFNEISIQNQLETYVENNIGKCVNFSLFEELGNNITLANQNISINSMFNEPDGLSIYAYFPFDVKLDSNTITTSAEFEAVLDLNVKRLYYYTFDFMKNYLKDPFFNISKWDSSHPNYDEIDFLDSFNFYIIKNVCQYSDGCNIYNEYDDLIVFEDRSSFIKGETLKYIFAIKQRNPILEYMHTPNLQTVYENKDGKKVKINYQYLINDTIIFESPKGGPLAIDPDKDNLKYTYSGWRENYTTYFNYSCCFKSLGHGIKKMDDGGYEPCDDLDTNCVDCNLTTHEICMIKNVTDEAHNWTSSLLFLANPHLGMASYVTNEKDVGYHEVTLSVEDEHGGKDFQIIKLLVFDFPVALLKTFNLYDDIDDSYASVEDYFVLNGSGSRASVLAGGSLSQFLFEDFNEPFTLTRTTNYCNTLYANSLNKKCYEVAPINLSYLVLPINESNINSFYPNGFNVNTLTKKLPPPSYVLTNETKTLWFDNRSNSFNSNLVEHNLSLIVRQLVGGSTLSSIPSTQKIYVAQCLPHGWTGNWYDNDAYPYDETTYSNVCCEPNVGDDKNYGTYRENNENCYDETGVLCYPKDETGQWVKFSNLGKAVYEPNKNGTFSLATNSILGSNFTFPNSDVNSLELTNDVFNVSFVQKCSGKRGNVCSGDFDVVFSHDFNGNTNAGDCADFDNLDGLTGNPIQFARCQGPSEDLDNCNNNYVGTLHCKNYSEFESFEDVYYDDLKYLFSQNPYSGHENAIDNGFCGSTLKAEIVLGSPTINSPLSGNFDCNATCNNGKCDYWQLEACACNYGNPNCDGITANNLFDEDGNTYFYCKDNDEACLSNCNYKSGVDDYKESCYCAVNLGAGHDYLTTVVEPTYDHFITPIVGYVVQPSIPSRSNVCCLEGNYVFDTFSNKVICANGNMPYDTISKIYHYKHEKDRVLFYLPDKKFYYCKERSEINKPGFINVNPGSKIPPLPSPTAYSCNNGEWS